MAADPRTVEIVLQAYLRAADRLTTTEMEAHLRREVLWQLVNERGVVLPSGIKVLNSTNFEVVIDPQSPTHAVYPRRREGSAAQKAQKN